MTLSKEELQAIADIVTNNVMQRIENNKQQEQQVQDKITYAEYVQEQAQEPKVEVKSEETQPYTFKSLREFKAIRKAQKEADERRARDEERAQRTVKCVICGEEFHPTSAVNKVCPNKLCREINKYNGVIKKHIQERQEELAREME